MNIISHLELKTLFRVDHCIDMETALPLLANAISDELAPISEEAIEDIWGCSMKWEDRAHIVDSDGDGRRLHGIPIMFRRYATFTNLLGSFVLNQEQAAHITDEWVTNSMPRSLAILNAFKDITVEYLAETSLRMKSETGVSPGEVFAQVEKTGESFQQTAKRMQFKAKGLQVVRGDDPEP